MVMIKVKQVEIIKNNKKQMIMKMIIKVLKKTIKIIDIIIMIKIIK